MDKPMYRLSPEGAATLATLQNLDAPLDINTGIEESIEVIQAAEELVFLYCNDLTLAELNSKAYKMLNLLIDLRGLKYIFMALRAEEEGES